MRRQPRGRLVAEFLPVQEEGCAPMDSDQPELTPEQLAALTGQEREAYQVLGSMDPGERARFQGHLELVSVVWRFLRAVVLEGDLRAGWASVDPVLRLCLAQQWALDNAAAVAAGGYDREALAAALAQEQPVHERWPDFERVHVKGLRQILPSADTWGIGGNTRLVAPDVELLYLHDTRDLSEGVWRPDQPRRVWPLLMRWDHQNWLILNVSSETFPQPGWPPVLS